MSCIVCDAQGRRADKCGPCGLRDRDARWMAVVRRLWRQRDTLSALVKQDCADLVQSQNAYEDEHRRATRLQERVSWLESQRQWVDVRERLPEPEKWVLGLYGDRWEAVVHWDGEWITQEGGGCGCCGQDHWEGMSPTHWVSLPEAPKET